MAATLTTKATDVYEGNFNKMRRKSAIMPSGDVDIIIPTTTMMTTTISPTMSTIFPKLQDNSTKMTNFRHDYLATNIPSCPRFERLRQAAQQDRIERYIKRRDEHNNKNKEEEEHLQQKEQTINMSQYYTTLYQLSLNDFTNSTYTEKIFTIGGIKGNKTPPLSRDLSLQNVSFRTRDMLLKDIYEYFIEYYYKINPNAYLSLTGEKEMAENRRQSARLSRQLTLLNGGVISSSKNTSQQQQQQRGGGGGGGGKNKKGHDNQFLTEGLPATNLQVILFALLEISDSSGHISCDGFISAFKRIPFEVQNTDGLEIFFSIVRASSSLHDINENENERRLNTSNNTCVLNTRGQRRRSLHVSNIPSITGTFSPAMSVVGGGLSSNLKRSTQGIHGSQSIIRRNLPSSYPIRGGINSTTGLDVMEHSSSSSVVLIQELLAAIDAVINSPELRETVRLLCFNVLENDGFIHKATLSTYRCSSRESCEEKDAVVTPSMIKALGDVLDLLLQEEEMAFLSSQSKGKKQRKKNKINKPPILLPHQKSSIPLNMMRRSHINFKEFSRFFDELPILTAAFAHIWFPAFFGIKELSGKKITRYGSLDDGHIDENNEEGTSDGARSPYTILDSDKELVGTYMTRIVGPTQRYNIAKKVIEERLEKMKPILSSDGDSASQQ